MLCFNLICSMHDNEERKRTPHDKCIFSCPSLSSFLLYQVVVYFLLGCLEIYPALSNIWATGLVLQNYTGIINLICSPLLPPDKRNNGRSGPLEFADISSKKKKRNITI
jgi:hypothetical protein